jgi:hypothetical protein
MVSAIRKGKIRECFLSGMTSDQVLMHAIRMHNVQQNSVEEVFISDICYRQICGSNDELVARCWYAYQQALSAGYTESGFVAKLQQELLANRFNLALATFACGLGSYFISYSRPLSRASGKLCLWCKSRSAIPLKIVESADRQIPHIVVKHTWPWINDRWLIATPPIPGHPVELAQPPWHEALYEQATRQWGSPPDIFDFVITSGEMSSGFEFIRRLLC